MITTIHANKDAYVTSEEGYENTNYGSGEVNAGEPWTGEYFCHGFFGFDLSSIPANAIISAAVINFHTDWFRPLMEGCEATFYNFTASWDENTITCENAPSATNEIASAVLPGNINSEYLISASGSNLVSAINALRPNGSLSLMLEICAPAIANIYGNGDAYLTITHQLGTIKVASAAGPIDKSVLDVIAAVTAGQINKRISKLFAAPAQGSIDKTIL